ncbi:hypothetical protein [Paenibacillus dendrobii]|uniref:hypothetical protein n=1 Tax=Paenibacillus dendrobii TaxID=2691084 RepID=UPI001F3234B2|nr:hypothetical protein [Paenibacillus dendrobii]
MKNDLKTPDTPAPHNRIATGDFIGLRWESVANARTLTRSVLKKSRSTFFPERSMRAVRPMRPVRSGHK